MRLLARRDRNDRSAITDGGEQRTDELDPQPGLDALPALLDQLRAAGLTVELTTSGPDHPLPAGADLALYRVVQEAMTNVINHAPGAAAQVTVTRTGGGVEVLVVNGAPTGPDTGPGGGRGLIGMQERARLYGGTFHAGPTPQGFEVRVSLPDTHVPA